MTKRISASRMQDAIIAEHGEWAREASKRGALPMSPSTRSKAPSQSVARKTSLHAWCTGEMRKRSEWLKQWNQRQVFVEPQLISWYDRGKRTGSCVSIHLEPSLWTHTRGAYSAGPPLCRLALDRNCIVATTVDGWLVVQTSRGREVQFRCDHRAELHGWLRAVQLAARPAAPGALPPPALSEHLPPTALLPALMAHLPCAPRGCEALFAPSSPPPPPQLLSKEAISSIDWGTVRHAHAHAHARAHTHMHTHTHTPCACHAHAMRVSCACHVLAAEMGPGAHGAPRAAHSRASPRSSLTCRSPRTTDGVPTSARQPAEEPLERLLALEPQLELYGGEPAHGASHGGQVVGGCPRIRDGDGRAVGCHGCTP